MHPQPERVQFLDFMRGFAVIVMVIGHTVDSVLSPEARATSFFTGYNFFRGFTAPLFLFVSGFAFMAATEPRWMEYRHWGKPLGRRIFKMVLLLVIGYALHIPFFSFYKLVHTTDLAELVQFFQADVLHCLAFSILLLHLLIIFHRRPDAFVITLAGLTVALVLLTPIVWSIDFGPIVTPAFSPLMNQTQLSIFPLFPFAGFLFAGVIMGHLYLSARMAGNEQRFFRTMPLVGLLLVVAGVLLDMIPLDLYPPHDYWKTSPTFFSIRLGAVMVITTAFNAAHRLPKLVRRNLVIVGGSSLVVYVVHLVLVYGSALNAGLAQIYGMTFFFPKALVAGVVVVGIMLAFVHVWNAFRHRFHTPARLVRYGIASALVFMFFTNPY